MQGPARGLHPRPPARHSLLKATLPGRDDSGTVDFPGISATPVLVGALYVPYGIRSVYTVDVRGL
ncbi:hypothetical protein [Streptomyces sp. NPDC057301]|uniref:hypothetical protein n=1 Tax=Streptomyces sp. NPDC057301 TaxID=3346093 RepID=UPI003640F230